MSKVNELGNNLSLILEVEASNLQSFLSCLCWYSLQKNLPDSKLVIACARPATPSKLVFGWSRRVGVPFFYYQKNNDPNKTIQIAIERNIITFPVVRLGYHDVCLGSLNDDIINLVGENDIVNLNDNIRNSSFYSILYGCGLFVPSNWIHRDGHPFGMVDLFSKGDLTVNEQKVFSLCKKLCPLYDMIA